MSRAIKQNETVMPEIELSLPGKILSFWPVIASVGLALVFILARLYGGPRGFLYEGDLTMLAFISYLSAGVLLVTNIFVKEKLLARIGIISIILGYCFNLSGWMIRWIEAGDKEGWKDRINGIWGYFPLDNLYALTIGFCAGAALTVLILIRKPKYEFVGALSMPIITVILALGIFLGNQINTLPPILDSYWRPIHVSIATFGYGVCLVSFGVAFAYLIKDGIRSEAVAIGAGLYGLLVFFTVGRFAVPWSGDYAVNVMMVGPMGSRPMEFRASLPFVGPLMLLTLIAVGVSIAAFFYDHFSRNESARKWGWRLFRTAAVLQGFVLLALFVQIKSVDNIVQNIPAREQTIFVQSISKEAQAPSLMSLEEAQRTFAQNSRLFDLSVNSNPVEFGGLIGLFVALAMVALFAWRRDDVLGALPSLKTLDSLLYRTVGVAFPLLTLLLITGAVWANESWGRYWGWDSKEVGALVAWMAYAGFLHTRIAHGWRGRRSAYFALLGFALVIFTWLGVSFLLPGLHSYAGV